MVWVGTIGGHLDEIWSMGYTDGTGANGEAAAGVFFSEGWRAAPT